MKKIAFIIPFSFALLNTVSYANEISKPEKCPSAAAIQAVGLNKAWVQKDKESGSWLAFRLDELYDTNDHWTFAVGKIPASDADDAFLKATEGLKSLKQILGPIPYVQGKWMCGYFTQENYVAVAVTPAVGYDSLQAYLR